MDHDGSKTRIHSQDNFVQSLAHHYIYSRCEIASIATDNVIFNFMCCRVYMKNPNTKIITPYNYFQEPISDPRPRDLLLLHLVQGEGQH